jgi:hypothetical protein
MQILQMAMEEQHDAQAAKEVAREALDVAETRQKHAIERVETLLYRATEHGGAKTEASTERTPSPRGAIAEWTWPWQERDDGKHWWEDEGKPQSPPAVAHTMNLTTAAGKQVILRQQVGFDPCSYGSDQCSDWCATRDPPRKLGGGNHDWESKCTWDNYCAGCPECDAVEDCHDWCETWTDPDAEADFKTETKKWDEICSWGPCHGCEPCQSVVCYPPEAPKPPPMAPSPDQF